MADEDIDGIVQRAQAGDAAALEEVVRRVQDRVHRLAVRMLGDPEAARDATQEVLIRIVTALGSFDGNSRFTTWVYRVAVNKLLTTRRAAERDRALSFDMFGADLIEGLADEMQAAPETHVMLNDLRIRCTMAMLLCLDPDHRVAYVLGEVFEMTQAEACDVLDIPAATFRKRLSRARAAVRDFTARSCGLASERARCSCRKRLPAAMAVGRIGDTPTAMFEDAPDMDRVQAEARRTEAALVAAKLQRATGSLAVSKDFSARIRRIVDPPPT